MKSSVSMKTSSVGCKLCEELRESILRGQQAVKPETGQAVKTTLQFRLHILSETLDRKKINTFSNKSVLNQSKITTNDLFNTRFDSFGPCRGIFGTPENRRQKTPNSTTLKKCPKIKKLHEAHKKCNFGCQEWCLNQKRENKKGSNDQFFHNFLLFQTPVELPTFYEVRLKNLSFEFCPRFSTLCIQRLQQIVLGY